MKADCKMGTVQGTFVKGEGEWRIKVREYG
jgi:hypothetical protein